MPHPSIVHRTEHRLNELRTLLETRRLELVRNIQIKLKVIRIDADAGRDGVEPDSFAPADVTDDLELTLIQMQSRVLAQVDAALQRLENGSYGECSGCGEPIATERLRVMPFAVRCTPCEGRREAADGNGASRHCLLRFPGLD